MEVIISSAITALFAFLGVAYAAKKQNNVIIEKMQSNIDQIHTTTIYEIRALQTNIDTLSKRVDKHNNVIERVYELETQNRIFETRLNEIEDRKE